MWEWTLMCQKGIEVSYCELRILLRQWDCTGIIIRISSFRIDEIPERSEFMMKIFLVKPYFIGTSWWTQDQWSVSSMPSIIQSGCSFLILKHQLPSLQPISRIRGGPWYTWTVWGPSRVISVFELGERGLNSHDESLSLKTNDASSTTIELFPSIWGTMISPILLPN